MIIEIIILFGKMLFEIIIYVSLFEQINDFSLDYFVTWPYDKVILFILFSIFYLNIQIICQITLSNSIMSTLSIVSKILRFYV